MYFINGANINYEMSKGKIEIKARGIWNALSR